MASWYIYTPLLVPQPIFSLFIGTSIHSYIYSHLLTKLPTFLIKYNNCNLTTVKDKNNNNPKCSFLTSVHICINHRIRILPTECHNRTQTGNIGKTSKECNKIYTN